MAERKSTTTRKRSTAKTQKPAEPKQNLPEKNLGTESPSAGAPKPKASASKPREDKEPEGRVVGKYGRRADVDAYGAYTAGHLASVHGTASKPPKGATDKEIEDWYAGYKAHANPNATSTVEPKEGEERQPGYRKDY